MQFLSDFWPIVAFFAAYWLGDVYIATGVLMVAMTIQIVWQWLRSREINKMLLVSGALVLVFGGATLFLQDRAFIQLKPTVVNWLFALAFLSSQWIGSKTIAERVMGSSIDLPKPVWRELNLLWVLYFIALGCANLFVVYRFDEAVWVNFKLFGTLGFTVLMVLAQALVIYLRAPGALKENS